MDTFNTNTQLVSYHQTKLLHNLPFTLLKISYIHQPSKLLGIFDGLIWRLYCTNKLVLNFFYIYNQIQGDIKTRESILAISFTALHGHLHLCISNNLLISVLKHNVKEKSCNTILRTHITLLAIIHYNNITCKETKSEENKLFSEGFGHFWISFKIHKF